MDILDEESLSEYDNVEIIPPSVPLFATYKTDTCVICYSFPNKPWFLRVCSRSL